MKHHGLLKAVVLLSMAFLAGCKKDITSDDTVPNQLIAEKNYSAPSPGISTELKEKIRTFRTSLPEGHEQRFKLNAERLINIHPEYRQVINAALNIEAGACENNTDISKWLNSQLTDWDADITYMAVASGMLDFPKYHAMLFDNFSSSQYFGNNGSLSQKITKTSKDLKRFWDIETSDLVVTGMHGAMLRDREKVKHMNMMLYGHDDAGAETWADLTISLLEVIPQYRKGDHPIFTFNAFARGKFFYPPVGVIPEKIVLGDGLLEGLQAIGYGDVAPQAIHAHEYAHHIQFQTGLTGNVLTPEDSRRVELMADAFAAYYLSHARGATMQWKRVKQFLQVFFNIGDCGITSTAHHGTPVQRTAAAEWGYQVAENAKKQGHILSSQQFAAMFEAHLPALLSR